MLKTKEELNKDHTEMKRDFSKIQTEFYNA